MGVTAPGASDQGSAGRHTEDETKLRTDIYDQLEDEG